MLDLVLAWLATSPLVAVLIAGLVLYLVFS